MLENRSIKEIISLINKKEISVREVVNFYLERIKKYNPSLNAIVSIKDEEQIINEANDKLKKLLENEDIPINDLKLAIEDLTKASQSFAEKLYADAQNDTSNTSSDESDDVVEGEVIEDE